MTTGNVFIGLGSNLGDSAHTLQKAWQRLGQLPEISLVAISSPFISSPVGMDSSRWFTNAVGLLTVTCSPYGLLEALLKTEESFGRLRDASRKGYQDRTIDLDLLYFDALIMDDPRLTLPHPRRASRLFVLAPLVEIAPDFIDPESGKSVSVMHEELLETLKRKHLAAQEINPVKWPPLS